MTTALITGASAGLGAEFARQLAAAGHDLVLVARSRDRLEALAAELSAAHGTRAEVLVADLADRAEVERVADRLRSDEAPVEILVNNAGLGLPEGLLEHDVAVEEAALDVMVRSVLVLSHAAALAMRARGRGAILNVASVAAFAVMGTYSATKSWVTVFTESLANDLRGTGVTATAVCPGFTHTEFHDRAQMDMSALPEALWLDAPRVVVDALAAARSGRVMSVPSPQWWAISQLSRLSPRPVVRRVSAALSGARLNGTHG